MRLDPNPIPNPPRKALVNALRTERSQDLGFPEIVVSLFHSQQKSYRLIDPIFNRTIWRPTTKTAVRKGLNGGQLRARKLTPKQSGKCTTKYLTMPSSRPGTSSNRRAERAGDRNHCWRAIERNLCVLPGETDPIKSRSCARVTRIDTLPAVLEPSLRSAFDLAS